MICIEIECICLKYANTLSLNKAQRLLYCTKSSFLKSVKYIILLIFQCVTYIIKHNVTINSMNHFPYYFDILELDYVN